MQNLTRSCFNTASPAAVHRHPAAAVAAQSPARAGSFVTIIDPAFRSGKIDIPIEKTTATKGRDEWIEGKLRNRDLSLCCLFQKGRCHAQERCHQVHADRDFVTSLRNQQSTLVSCCRHCHDTASMSAAAMNFFAANMPSAAVVNITFGENDEPNAYPADRVAYTDGLIQQFRDHGCKVENGAINVPARRVCRLHAKGVCKYGKDCKNVHVCCQLGEAVMVRRQPSSSKTPSSSAIVRSPAAAIRPEAVAIRASLSPASPASSFQHRAVTPATVPAVQTMPVFSMPPAPIISSAPRDGLESTATPLGARSRSGMLKTLDADSLNESSGRLRALVFDVLKCLDDSRVEVPKTVNHDDDNAEDNFSYFSSTKTSARTVSSTMSENCSPNTKTLNWGAWHPMNNTPKVNISSPAAVDTNTFLRYF